MPFVTSEKLLKNAQRDGYAVGAFNVENMEMIQAVIEAAEELSAPVILQTTPSTVRYAGLELFYANVRSLAEKASVPVVLHLDHGDSFNLAMKAIRAGYTSVMIDGSKESYEENVLLSRRVVEAAAPSGLPVEAELGMIGGKEDSFFAEGGLYTDPAQAVDFVERTGISSLAVAIGTAHGFYKGEPKLELSRLREIRREVSIPLVMHGASGLSDESIRAAVQEGICKVNFATELRVAYSEGVRKALKEDQNAYDPKVYGKQARARVKELVMERMRVVGCDGKCGGEDKWSSCF